MIYGKPPFRAANQIELIKKIEISNNHIQFPENNYILNLIDLKDLISGLLIMDPFNRIEFVEFFQIPSISSCSDKFFVKTKKFDLSNKFGTWAPENSIETVMENGNKRLENPFNTNILIENELLNSFQHKRSLTYNIKKSTSPLTHNNLY